jgi:hypothetical protein
LHFLFALLYFIKQRYLEFHSKPSERRKTMLFIVALFVVPALAAFSFQLICYINHKEKASRSSSQQWGHREALHNI